jgi:hypothetical protein
MFAPVTSDPATGTADPPAGAADPPDGAPPAAGVAGLELVQPAIETAIITKIIAIKLICENFILILTVPLKFPETPHNRLELCDNGLRITISRRLLKNSDISNASHKKKPARVISDLIIWIKKSVASPHKF